MKPETDRILNFSAAALLTELAPVLPTHYAQGAASVHALLMLFAAQEFERGADNRAHDNAEMRRLFAELAPLASQTPLREDLERAAGETDSALTISALNESGNALKALLIRLQVDIEAQTGTPAQAARRRIWDLLAASAARASLSFPAMG